MSRKYIQELPVSDLKQFASIEHLLGVEVAFKFDSFTLHKTTVGKLLERLRELEAEQAAKATPPTGDIFRE